MRQQTLNKRMAELESVALLLCWALALVSVSQADVDVHVVRQVELLHIPDYFRGVTSKHAAAARQR